MSEDKSQTVIVKARAKAFLITKPEEELKPVVKPAKKRASKATKTIKKASEVAAKARRVEKNKDVETAEIKTVEIEDIKEVEDKKEIKDVKDTKEIKEIKEVKAKVVKVKEVKLNTFIEFNDMKFNQEEVVEKANIVWTKDLKNKASDLTSLELYMKPEENMVYYVFNKEVNGSFPIQ